ncbi:MAG: xanthine dehydrogenase accessory protein XdhC [Psychrobacter sp.]|nr:xanthine dehydrogenase accessory protein XdhC [Psychrobacter sp.]
MVDQLPKRWYEGLADCQQQGCAHVLATIIAVNGSAPRELQAKMVITTDTCCDTLGGGGLEHDVIMTARQLLAGNKVAGGKIAGNKVAGNEVVGNKAGTNKAAIDAVTIDAVASTQQVRRDSILTKHYPLGAKLGQCCGGSVTVMFECFYLTPPLSLLVFGAGHVAQALMTILSELPCQVDWVDNREEMFGHYLMDHKNETLTDEQADALIAGSLPAHIRPHLTDEPIDFIESHGSNRYILVMTHDHSLDFDLVRAALRMSQLSTDGKKAAYIGCIGSATKAKRFKDRLIQRGFDEVTVAQLTMPIGLKIGGKEPMAVAVSIAAQVLQHYHQGLAIKV